MPYVDPLCFFLFVHILRPPGVFPSFLSHASLCLRVGILTLHWTAVTENATPLDRL